MLSPYRGGGMAVVVVLGGGGCGTPALIQESDPVEVKLPGCVIHAHTSIRAGLRPGGECGSRRRRGCCCMLSLASHP